MELVQIPLHAFHHFGPEGPGKCIRMAKKSDIVIELVLILGNGLLFVCYNGGGIIQLNTRLRVASVMPGKPLSTLETVLRDRCSSFAINAWVGLVTVRLIAFPSFRLT